MPAHFSISIYITGVKREVFEQMLEVVNEAKSCSRKHPTRGTPAKLSNADKLLLLLMYYREYRTQFHIGVTYGISESRVCEIIKEAEGILIEDSRFHLPGKKALLKAENHFEAVLIDVTESPVERPKKKQRLHYSGKKKRHTQKTQIVADKASRKILCTDFAKGRKHDFKLFKDSRVYLRKESKCVVDTGYQGMQKLHINSEHPKKRSKKHPLAKADKKQNRQISSTRITVENIIRDVKIFRIIAEKYRNRRRRFSLRFTLIAAIYNLNLNYS
ncbi:MAG: IS5 family transposase [Tannerella sp.]|nr:IS5 family transposase [Tannerella sp.]